MRARVIGVGQLCAGDDGVGLRVTARLRERFLSDLEVLDVADPTTLVDALDTRVRVVIVDALIGAVPGRVHHFRPEALATSRLRPVSSHGFSVAAAIELARALHGITPDLQLVGIEIARCEPGDTELSPAVNAAIDAVADAVVEIARS